MVLVTKQEASFLRRKFPRGVNKAVIKTVHKQLCVEEAGIMSALDFFRRLNWRERQNLIKGR